jgi:predicted component of type VI protein secretion system
VPFRPKPNGGKGADDIAALVQAEIDEIERRISHAEAAKHRASAPSIVKSVAPIKTTLVTPGDVHTPVATPVLETSPAGSEVATPTGKKRNVHTPVTTPVLQNDSEVVTPTQKQPPPRSDSMYSSAVDEPPESPVLEDKPRPEQYSRTDSGLFGEIRRTLTFEEKYVEDWDEEQELEEYTDEFEEVLKEYVQRSREVGLDVVRIGSVRRSI